MGINPVVSLVFIVLGAVLLYLVVSMYSILSTAPLLAPLAGIGGVAMVLLGLYMLVAVRGSRA